MKTILHDTVNWTNDLFNTVKHTGTNYKKMVYTWQEQRAWGLTYPLEALGDHPLREKIKTALDEINPPAPGALVIMSVIRYWA